MKSTGRRAQGTGNKTLRQRSIMTEYRKVGVKTLRHLDNKNQRDTKWDQYQI